MELLTEAIKKAMPAMYTQDGKGGDTVIVCKFFTPDSNWTWYVTEGEPNRDEAGRVVGWTFFGLVNGFEKELGYFLLSDLESVRGPLRLPVERDLYFGDKTLRDVAPEMFPVVEKEVLS